LAVVNSNNDTVSILLNTSDSAPQSATAPDLLVSQLSASVSGGTIVIGDIQQNIGAQAAGAFSVAFYFASNPTSPTGGTPIGMRSLTGLAANGSVNTASTLFPIPPNAPSGTYHVCAITDSGGAVNEADKTNNFRCTTQTYPIGPDLTVWGVSASLASTYITISDTVRNIGNRWADPSVVSFYFAANPSAPTAGTLIGARSVSGINGGSQYNSATTKFPIPDSTPTGTYYVCAASDSSGIVGELDESNNTRCTASTFVIGPDLIVFSLTAVKSGGRLYVADTQRNMGNRLAEASTVSFYLSFNTVLDAGDTPLGSRSVPNLAGGGALNSKTTPFPIPTGIAPGARYLIAISDSGTAVTELNEGNNSRYGGPYAIP
jgi:subtilase family serine protease